MSLSAPSGYNGVSVDEGLLMVILLHLIYFSGVCPCSLMLPEGVKRADIATTKSVRNASVSFTPICCVALPVGAPHGHGILTRDC